MRIPQDFRGWRDFGSYLVILGVCVAGLMGAAWWYAVPAAAVIMLWVSDRGQHRGLVERFDHLSPIYILMLSIGGSLLNNAFFCALAYLFGVGARWLWGPLR